MDNGKNAAMSPAAVSHRFQGHGCQTLKKGLVHSDILEGRRGRDDSRSLGLARQMYSTCMDTSARAAGGLQHLLGPDGPYGGWPVVLGAAWRQASFDAASMMGDVSRRYNHGLLFSLQVDKDLGAARNVIQARCACV